MTDGDEDDNSFLFVHDHDFLCVQSAGSYRIDSMPSLIGKLRE